MHLDLRFLRLVVLPLLLGFFPALSCAAQANRSFTTEPREMKACTDEASAKSLLGRERAAFLSECLKAAEPWGRIKTCNEEADGKHLKGEKREKFMGDCWRGKR